MKATDVLMAEHRLIERVLDALERSADRLDRGAAVRPGFFLDAAEFIAGFADGCHHRKEEGVLFGAMMESGVPSGTSPVDLMLEEHEQARALTRAMRDAARRLEAGDATAARNVVANARDYVLLLREHIEKEDEMLFPMADELIAPEQQDEMLAAFGRVERDSAGAGASERFRALAEQLERESPAGGA